MAKYTARVSETPPGMRAHEGDSLSMKTASKGATIGSTRMEMETTVALMYPRDQFNNE